MKHLVTLAALSACLGSTLATAQNTVVIPRGYASVAGNAGYSNPLGLSPSPSSSSSSWPGMRMLQVYDSTHFTQQGITTPILIEGIRWRCANTGSTPQLVLPLVHVDLSTAAVDYSAASTNWNSNHGSDRLRVHSGSVTNTPTTPQSPGQWCVDIDFPATPFLYNPGSGSDLVVDLDRPSMTGSVVTNIFHDAVNGTGAAGPALAAQVGATGNYPNASFVRTVGFVIELTYTLVSYATNTPYGDGCGATFASFYEIFAPGTLDLSNRTIAMVPNGGGYAVSVSPGSAWFTPTSTPLVVGNEQVVQRALGFALPYPGGSTSSIWFSSNGFVYGRSQSLPFCCTIAANLFLANLGPRWAAIWTDLDPSAGGSVHFDQDPANGVSYLTFAAVPESGTTNANSFQYAFFATGEVQIRLGSCAVTSHPALTGWSPGAGNADPGPTDLSATAAFATRPDAPALAHAPDARPVIGTTVSLETTNVPAAASIGATVLGILPQSQSLAAFGAPGCFQYVDFVAVEIFIPSGGVGSTPFVIANDPTFAGLPVRTQGAVLLPGINPLGAITSNANTMRLDLY